MAATPGEAEVLVAIFVAWMVLIALAFVLVSVAKRADELTAYQLATERPLDPPAAPPRRRPAPEPASPAYEELYGSLLLKRLAVQARRVLAADRCAILLEDPGDPRALIVIAAHGLDEDHIGRRIAADARLLSGVLHHGRAEAADVHAADLELEAILGPAKSALVAPVGLRTEARGALVAARQGPGREAGADAVDLARGLGELAGAAIDDARSHRRVQHAMVGAPLALREMIDAHCLVHGVPAADLEPLADEVGRRLGLDEVALVELRLAAVLHDVGRLVTGPCTASGDRSASVAVAAAGGEALRRIPGLGVIGIIVRHRAERWDGAGGPDALAAERIPLASRILSVCAAYEGLTQIPGADPLADLWDEAGARFDPAVVGALTDVLDPAASPSRRQALHQWGQRDLTFTS